MKVLYKGATKAENVLYRKGNVLSRVEHRTKSLPIKQVDHIKHSFEQLTYILSFITLLPDY